MGRRRTPQVERSGLGRTRALLLLVVACALVFGSGCSAGRAARPDGALAAALATESPTFRLRYPAGQHTVEQERLAGEVTLANCEASEPLGAHHAEAYAPDADLALDSAAIPVELAALRGVMAAMARESYRLAGDYPPAIMGQVELQAAAGVQQAYRLSWVETWDENVVAVLLEEALVAEVPVRVLMRVELKSEPLEATACSEAGNGDEPLVPLTLALSRPLETPAPTPMPTETPEPPGPVDEQPTAAPEAVCEAPAPATQAQQVVARYVDLLNNGDHAAAYALLAERYRLRLPFGQYAAGYAPVRAIALCSLETVEASGGREMVYATLRIALETAGATQDELWVGRYEVQPAGADTAGVIQSVTMFRAALQDD
jgi:hypothetical protein